MPFISFVHEVVFIHLFCLSFVVFFNNPCPASFYFDLDRFLKMDHTILHHQVFTRATLLHVLMFHQENYNSKSDTMWSSPHGQTGNEWVVMQICSSTWIMLHNPYHQPLCVRLRMEMCCFPFCVESYHYMSDKLDILQRQGNSAADVKSVCEDEEQLWELLHHWEMDSIMRHWLCLIWLPHKDTC